MNFTALAERIPDEAAAYEYLEELRWNGRPVCPHCGVIDGHYLIKPRSGERRTRTGKVTHRRLWKCHACREQFSVLVGTIFHRSKISIRTWLFVLFDMVAAKNGISAREIERKYNLTPRSAWFMAHRLREAMKAPDFIGKFSGTVQADETYIGPNPRNWHRKRRVATNAYKHDHKTPVVSLLHPATGEVRSKVVLDVTANTLRAVIDEQTNLAETVLHTDEAVAYTRIGWNAAGHERVNHSMSEYVRQGATTNNVEGFFSQLKRSLDGTHHHVSREHLPRYLAEFDFRYTTRKMSDEQRLVILLGRSNRRLTYRPVESSGSSLVA